MNALETLGNVLWIEVLIVDQTGKTRLTT